VGIICDQLTAIAASFFNRYEDRQHQASLAHIKTWREPFPVAESVGGSRVLIIF
jgi:hypothetical protein